MTIPRRQRHQQTLFAGLKRCSKQSPLLFGCLLWMGYLFSAGFLFHTNDEKERLFHSPNDLPQDLVQSLDAILVLGGGRPKSIDHPPVFVEKRCDDALEVVWRRSKNLALRNQDQLPILCLSAGTAHVPQLLSADGLPIWESTACAAYLNNKINATHSIKPESIYVETTSYDTIGNAYFARTTHTEFNGWRKLLVITNEFHMSRTQKIFDWIYFVDPPTVPYDLYYLQSPNVGMASQVITARKERETSSSKSVDHLSKQYTTLKQVYEFLTRQHALYTATKLVDKGRATSKEVQDASIQEDVKKSYGGS